MTAFAARFAGDVAFADETQQLIDVERRARRRVARLHHFPRRQVVKQR
jgi:hypothetical protein